MKRKPYPSQSRLKQLFDYSDGFMIERTNRRGTNGIGSRPTNKNNHGRWRMNVDSQPYLHSLLVWIWHKGDIPDDLELDHENMINSDDRIENLRLITRSENMQNRGDCNKWMPSDIVGRRKFRPTGLDV